MPEATRAPRRPRSSINFRRFLLVAIASLIAILVSACLMIWHDFVPFIYWHNSRMPSNLQSIKLHSVTEIKHQFSSSFHQPNVSMEYCKEFCTYWNPTIILFKGSFIVAARESTRSQCTGLFQSVVALAKMLLRPSRSSVLISRPIDGTNNSMKSINLEWLTRLPDYGSFKGSCAGYEDPRWIEHEDQLFLLSSRLFSGRPNLYLTRFGNGDSSQSLESSLLQPSTVRLVPQWQGAHAKQKNWMYVDMSQMDSDLKSFLIPENGNMLFVYYLDPFTLITVDPTDGRTFQWDQSPKTSTPSTSDLKGSTLFTPCEPVDGELASWIAIAHRSEYVYEAGGEHIDRYYSYFVRMAYIDGFQITHLSDAWSLPTTAGAEIASRISYPLSLILDGENVIVSFGDQDCTPHVAVLDKVTVFKSLKPI